MEIGAGSGQEACGRATQNASKIEKVEEKIDGCSAQEAEIEPPAKTRLEPKKPSKGLEAGRLLEAGRGSPRRHPEQGRYAPEKVWKQGVWQVVGPAPFRRSRGRPWRRLASQAPGRLWLAGSGKQARSLWQALAGSGRLWQVLAGSGSDRLWQALAALAGSNRLWQALAGSGRLWQALAGSGRL